MRATDGDRRFLPIDVGDGEATAVVLEQEGVEPVEPLTHDLIGNILAALGRPLLEVRIVDFREGRFKSELLFHGNVRVPARTSDSVNVAMRVGSPIYVEEGVLGQYGVDPSPDEQNESDDVSVSAPADSAESA
ncbi:hypothetical protein GCM10027089_58890 [Nocardia thraciensis]